MNDIQLEHLGMFVKVKTFLSNKSSELTPTPIVGSSLQDTLTNLINKILSEDETASGNISGNTELKRQLRQKVEDQGYEVAAACVAYYTITVPNPVLRAKCAYELSALQRMRDADLYVKIKVVQEIAEPIAANLLPFGVDATDVSDLNETLKEYFLNIQGPRDAIGERAASGKQVERLIEQTIEFLDTQLDVVMKYYVTNNAELHDYYLNARAIDQTGGGPVPDADYTETMASGQFLGGPCPPEINANSHIVVTNGASNGSKVVIGFSTANNSFSGVQTDVLPGTTGDFKAIDLGFTTGIPFFVLQNAGSPNPVSITVRIKAYY